MKTRNIKVCQGRTPFNYLRAEQLDNWHGLKQLEKSLKHFQREKTYDKLGHYMAWRINRQTTPDPHPCTLCTQNLWWRWLNQKIHHPKLYQTLQKELFSTKQMQKGSTISWVLKKNYRSSSCESSAESSREVKAELFVHYMLTANVMHFNNAINVLHDKRISFGDKTYNIRTALAVGFWNWGKPSPETKFGKLM